MQPQNPSPGNPPAATSPAPQVIVSAPSQGKSHKMVFYFLVLLGICVITVLIFWGIKTLTPNIKSKTDIMTKNGNDFDLISRIQESSIPVKFRSEEVAAVMVRYDFRAFIEKIIPSDSNDVLELKTSVSEPLAPKFIVTKDTILRFSRYSNSFPATKEDLKVGQYARIVAEYNLMTKTWATVRVAIIETDSNGESPEKPKN